MGMLRQHFYVYALQSPDGIPFYIGKGKGKRAWRHIINPESQQNAWKTRIINKIKKSGDEVTISIIKDHLLEPEALELECILIRKYGRRQFGGLLVNLTDGGEGISGYAHTTRTKKKLSQNHLGKEFSEKHKKAISESKKGSRNPMFRRVISEEHHRKLSLAHTGVPRPEYIKQKISETRKRLGLKPSEEAIRASIAANTGRKHSKEENVKCSISMTKYWETKKVKKEQNFNHTLLTPHI